MAEELPMVVLAARECLFKRDVGSTEEQVMESHIWTQSAPVQGVRIINTWQVYRGIWLVLTKTESGHYHIYRTIDFGQFTLVHDHNTEILNLFWVDDGHILFCATDGWWTSNDTGLNWSELTLGALTPQARSCALVGLGEGLWALVAYGNDHKIYHSEYPAGAWVEAYDTTAIYSDKWYSAMAGGPAGLLAGAGSKLLRSTQAGAAGSWQAIRDVDGIIKSIIISNQSNTPVFLIVVEPKMGPDQVDLIYMTYDLGDSLKPTLNRVGAVSSVQSVIPTGTNEIKTMFAVLGQRSAGGPAAYKLLEGMD